MFNSPITLTGRIVSDPEFHPANGHGALRIRLASSRSYQKDGSWKVADQLYINVEAWGKLAVNAHQSLLRGTAVIVQGMLYTNEWELPVAPDAPAGTKTEKRQEVRIRASSIGVDMNHYLVGFREVREPLVSSPAGVAAPENDTENYPDVGKRGQSVVEPAATSVEADAGLDGESEPSEDTESDADTELVGASAGGEEKGPPF